MRCHAAATGITEPRVVSQNEFERIFKRLRLQEDEFNPQTFLPGSSGASLLYRTLIEQSGIPIP
jgi:hypothetical protein